jgi:hypothetical protein
LPRELTSAPQHDGLFLHSSSVIAPGPPDFLHAAVVQGIFFFITKRRVDPSLASYFVLEIVISGLPLLAVLPLPLPPFHIQIV